MEGTFGSSHWVWETKSEYMPSTEGRMTRLLYSPEEEPLGTGGALRHALPLLDTDPVLVLNGDTYCNLDIGKFLRYHLDNGLQWTIAAGCPWTKEDQYVWKRAGAYLLSKHLIESIPPGQKLDLDRDVLPAREVGLSPHHYTYSVGDFLDIGTPDTYAVAESWLRGKGVLL